MLLRQHSYAIKNQLKAEQFLKSNLDLEWRILQTPDWTSANILDTTHRRREQLEQVANKIRSTYLRANFAKIFKKVNYELYHIFALFVLKLIRGLLAKCEY